ncbi:hypothetical protein LEP1GSC052_1953 [Leptospira kmetyi serovar Malaysia str. Bejo-Iso9]|nr:hypothetical protein LEP1GSC052_1953 [Leptospira kmetyi serovar Malaysia str. Bejo-Iso9]
MSDRDGVDKLDSKKRIFKKNKIQFVDRSRERDSAQERDEIFAEARPEKRFMEF